MPALAIPSLQHLRWQCRRGMLELDLVFGEFLEKHYETLNITEKQKFAELLTYADQDLQQWILGKASPADSNLLDIIEKIRSN